MSQVGVGHEHELCITFPVRSSFAARTVGHLEKLNGAFAVASDSASQSTFVFSVFFNVTILPELH